MERLETNYSVKSNVFTLNFSLNKSVCSFIKIQFPFNLEKIPKILLNELAYSCTGIVASLTVPKKIEMQFELRDSKKYKRIFDIIYEARFYEENEKIFYPSLNYPVKRFRITDIIKNKKVFLSFSGGLDSTYSLVLLKKNKFSPMTFSTNINLDQWNKEKKAIKKISKQLKVRNFSVYVKFPKLKYLGKKYSNKFSKYPEYNSIPWGRDLLHAFIGQILAWKDKSRYICFGHEHELWTNKENYYGKTIWKNELQGEEANVLLNDLLKKNGFQIFSPVSNLKKYNIYIALRKHYPSLFNQITSCFFGKKCGKCLNCLLYQRLENIYFDKIISTERFLEILLKTKDLIKKETFAETLYYSLWDAIHKNINNKKYKKELYKRYSHLINVSKKDAYHLLTKNYKTKLVPKGFKTKWNL